MNKFCKIFLYPFTGSLDSNTFSLLKKISSENRVKRSERFVEQKDKIRSILGDNLIRYSIHKSFNLKPSSMEFRKNFYGKPSIKGRPDIHFSLSYTEGLIGCAVSTEPVGFDLEKVKEIDISIARRYFTEEEYLYIEGCGNEKKQKCFFEIWTLKESYIKAIGMGLSCPLKSFSINKEEENISIELKKPVLTGLRFKLIPMGDKFISALCYSDEITPEKPTYISTVDIVEVNL